MPSRFFLLTALLLLAAPLYGAGPSVAPAVASTGPLDLTTAPKTEAELKKHIWHYAVRDPEGLYDKIRSALYKRLDNPDTCEISFFSPSVGDRVTGRFKRNKLRFRHQGSVDFYLHVREDDLNHMLKEKSHKLKLSKPRMTLHRGWVDFAGSIKVLFFKNRVKVAGRLVVRGGDKVDFQPAWMNMGFMPVPGFVVRKIARRVNPIADFKNFKIKMNLGILETTRDTLYIATASMRDEVDRLKAEEAARRQPAAR